MKIILYSALIIISTLSTQNAFASTASLLDNYYKPDVTNCKLETKTKPNDSIQLAHNLVVKNDKRFTAAVYQLEASQKNEYSNTYYYRISFNGKVVSNLIINTLLKMHPHGGEPDGVNIGVTACSGNLYKPTLKIGSMTKKLNGYTNPQYMTHIQTPFDWKSIIIKK